MAEEKDKTSVEETQTDTQENKEEKQAKTYEDLAKVLDTEAVAQALGIDESKLTEVFEMSNLEKEQNPYLKSDLSELETKIKDADGKRLDDIADGGSVAISDGTLSKNEDGTIHCKSEYLGEFDYNPDEFAYGYKEITEADGSVSQLPVLQYIGDSEGANRKWGFVYDVDRWTGGSGYDLYSSTITIPEGLKSGDYMFANNTKLVMPPRLPDSLKSAHCMFANCTSIEYHPHAAKDGECPLTNGGGAVYFPEGLEDMSGMYKNCKTMQGDFGELPKSVVNISECWEGCEEMGTNGTGVFFWYQFKIPEFGGMKNPYLAYAFSKDALNDISSEKVKEVADNAEYIVDKEGQINSKYKEDVDAGKADGSIDDDKLDTTQAQAALDRQEDVRTGAVQSEVELASNGSRSLNKVYNASTNGYEYDETGELKSDAKGANSWQRYVIDGVVGLGAFGLSKKLTGSTLVGAVIGVGSAVALDATDILPESFAPILTWTADLLPEGGAKDKLLEWADKVSGSTISDQKEQLTPEAVAGMHQEMRLEDGMSYVRSVEFQDISVAMKNNGYAAAENMALWSTAHKGEDSANTVQSMIAECTKAMEDQWASEMTDGVPSDEQKERMKSYYDKMFSALNEYNTGAKEGIKDTFGNNEVRAELSQYGLNAVNRAYVGSLMDSLNRMNEQYQLYTAEELKQLQGKYSIDGIGDISMYKDESSFADIVSSEQLEINSLVAVDTVEGEYGQSAAESGTVASTSEVESSTSDDVTKTKSSPSVTSAINENSGLKKNPEAVSKDYGKRAEEEFGYITEKQGTQEMSMDF